MGATNYKNGMEWLGACRLYARRNASCLTSGFLTLVVREAPGLGTMAVTKDAKLLFDPELRLHWTVKQGATVLFHELWHLLRHHTERCERNAADRFLWNIAGDAEINDDIKSGTVWEFPNESVTGKPFSPVFPKNLFETIGEKGGMPDGDFAENYWTALRDRLAKQKKQPGGSGGKGDGKKDDGSGSGSGTCTGKPGPGCCGSGAGNPVPNEPAPDGKGRTQAELERMRRDVAEAVRTEAASGRGNMPGGWLRWAEQTLTPPKIPWQTKLAKTIRNANSWAAGQVDYHYTAPSRRQAGVGFGPGRPVLPALRRPRPEILCVVDTSGSMGDEELTIGLSEIRGILNTTAANVTFCAADAAVHELRKVKTWREIIPLMKGGGGTDFRPAFEAASSRMRPRPNVVIFVTDGDGTCPSEPPPGMRVIWLLTGKHAHQPCDWGEHIRLE